MSWILIFIIVVVIAIVASAFLNKKSSGDRNVGFPYQPEELLFSAAERSFLGVLDQAVGPEHRVFGKVRIADVAKVKSGLSKSARQGALNRIASKHFDFVICRSSDLGIVCAVELNDQSHSSQRARARDLLVENVCKVIHLPLLQVVAKKAYSHHEVRDQFHASLGLASEGNSVGA